MIRPLPLAALAAALSLSAVSAPALDLEAMSPEERAAFGAEVRGYLIENPEVLMEALQVLESRQAQAQAAADADLIAAHEKAIFDDGYSWVGGNPDGDVTIVEFMDYRCGYCKRAHADVSKLLESDGNIRLVIKEFPVLGPESEIAARFATATRMVAGDAAYAEVHEALMGLRGAINEKSLIKIGKKAGIDLDAVQAKMDSPEVKFELLTNRSLAQALGINGTPGFVMGEEILRGYLPLEQMRELVAQERG